MKELYLFLLSLLKHMTLFSGPISQLYSPLRLSLVLRTDISKVSSLHGWKKAFKHHSATICFTDGKTDRLGSKLCGLQLSKRHGD